MAICGMPQIPPSALDIFCLQDPDEPEEEDDAFPHQSNKPDKATKRRQVCDAFDPTIH